MFWNSYYSFEELSDILLLPMRGPLKLPPTIFAVEHRLCPEHIESESAMRFYDAYRQHAPDKEVYDLSQKP